MIGCTSYDSQWPIIIPRKIILSQLPPKFSATIVFFDIVKLQGFPTPPRINVAELPIIALLIIFTLLFGYPNSQPLSIAPPRVSTILLKNVLLTIVAVAL